MVAKLNESFIVYKLAQDLGLTASDDPVRAVIRYCHSRIRAFLEDFPECPSPGKLLEWVANKLGTQFREIRDDKELQELKQEYVSRGEFAFADIDREFQSGTEGITLRLQHRHPWEPQYVSVIDCRGRRHQRRYHTKWHELGHLLILTDQARLAFRRSHETSQPKSAEESLVDAIAGEMSFYPPMVLPLLSGEISFEKIDNIRAAICGEASQYSAILNIAKLWPTPCIWVEAALRYKKSENRLGQARFAFSTAPAPVLRAAHVLVNESAKECGLMLIPNSRVPRTSIIYRVFHESLGRGEAVENLNQWSSSDGTTLQDQLVLVKAKEVGDAVHGLIIPVK